MSEETCQPASQAALWQLSRSRCRSTRFRRSSDGWPSLSTVFGSILFLHEKNEKPHPRPYFFVVFRQKRIVQSFFRRSESLIFALAGRFTEAVSMLLRSSESLTGALRLFTVPATQNSDMVAPSMEPRPSAIPLATPWRSSSHSISRWPVSWLARDVKFPHAGKPWSSIRVNHWIRLQSRDGHGQCPRWDF